MKIYRILIFFIIGCSLSIYAEKPYKLGIKVSKEKRERKNKARRKKKPQSKVTSPPSDGRPHHNCYWVLRGRLLAGEYPRGDNLKRCLDVGITFFVDLSGMNISYIEEHRENALKQGKTLEYRSMPIKDNDVPTPEYMKVILDTIDEALKQGHNIYVHCHAGVGRTGTVIGCFLVRNGVTGSEALNQLARWWSTVEKSKRFGVTPGLSVQREFIINYRETQQDALL